MRARLQIALGTSVFASIGAVASVIEILNALDGGDVRVVVYAFAIVSFIIAIAALVLYVRERRAQSPQADAVSDRLAATSMVL